MLLLYLNKIKKMTTYLMYFINKARCSNEHMVHQLSSRKNLLISDQHSPWIVISLLFLTVHLKGKWSFHVRSSTLQLHQRFSFQFPSKVVTPPGEVIYGIFKRRFKVSCIFVQNPIQNEGNNEYLWWLNTFPHSWMLIAKSYGTFK